MTFSARELGSIEAIAELAPAWADLASRAEGASLFVSPEWQLCWLKSSQGVSPATLVLEDATGRLRGVLPMARSVQRFSMGRLRITQLAGFDVASGDHLGLVSMPEDLAAAWDGAGRWLDQEVVRSDLVRFPCMDAGPGPAAVLRLARERGWRCSRGPLDVAPFLRLPVSPALDDSRGKRARYYQRRLEKERGPVSFRSNDEVKSLEEVLENMIALHTRLWRSRGRSGTLGEARKRRFLSLFCHEAERRGWLRLHQMYAGERLAAAMVVFHWNRRAYYYQSGWDLELRPFNAGEILLWESIRRASDEGMTVFDFLRGDEPYKRTFTAEHVELTSCDVAASFRGRLFLQGAGWRRAAGALARRTLRARRGT